MIKNRVWTILISYFLVACSGGSNTEEVTYSGKGIHFFPGFGAEIAPITLLKDSLTYHLFYSTGSKEWGHAISENLVHWYPANSLEMDREVNGDVVFDESNSSELGGVNDRVWIAIYRDSGKMAGKYCLNNTSWKDFSLNMPTDMTGDPKVVKDASTGKWIMTLAAESKVSILSSADLVNWQPEHDFTIPFDAKIADLIPIPPLWVIFYSGTESYYQVGTLSNFNFLPDGPPVKIQWTDRPVSIGGILENGETKIIHNIGKPTFSIAKRIELARDSSGIFQLLSFHSEELNKQLLSKKRSRLDNLKGEQSPRFAFTVDQPGRTIQLILSNSINQSMEIYLDKEKSLLTIQKLSGAKESIPLTTARDTIQFDVFIDHHTLEIFINEGEWYYGTLINPSEIYSKVAVKIDGAEFLPKAVSYEISGKPQ